MSRIEQIYEQVKMQIQKYLDSILERVYVSTSTEFADLGLVQHLVKVFTSLLTYLATSYELVRYFTQYKLADLLKV